MKSPTNVWIVVENWHSMARAISIFMSYAKDVALVSIMTKSLVTNTTYRGSRSKIIYLKRADLMLPRYYGYLNIQKKG